MTCGACGFENPEGLKFCGECGQALKVPNACPRCGFANPPAFKFCGECGATLGGAPSRGERAPRDYTPKHLAEKILRSKSALEGERKQVTVLFADVKGSMELAERMDPEEWSKITTRFFQILSHGVERFEGFVDKFTGDGIMALFGAPIAHEDHAQRACYAALHLRDEIGRYAEALRLSQGIDFAVRVGINSGEVVVGRIGDDLRMDYTAQGHTVGMAHRMEQLAAAHSVCLSESTAKLVSGYMELRDLGTSAVKGASGPIRVFELLGTGKHRTRLEVARSRGLTRFVGRDADLQTLEAALEQARAGEGHVIGVVAEAGTGKSRLCFEFVERCRRRGISVNEGHCPAHGKTVAYLPVFEMLRDVFAIDDRDSDQEARRKIAGELLLLDEGFREQLPLVFDFLGVPDPERPAPSMSPEARQRQLFAFVRHLTRARSERELRVLLLDDAHWIDAGSDAFLAQAVDAANGTRTLLLVNFRPEYHADWMSKPSYRQVPLRPLGREATAELLADFLGRDGSLAGLSETIHERTRGNPFFIEEVVLSLIESGCLEGARGAYRLVAPPEALEIPGAVQAVLAARIDRLPEREKQLLQTASVIGKEVPGPVLERVAGLSDAERAASLAALVQGEFLFEKALYPEAEYAFKHPLTQEVALGSQLRERRRHVHAAAARAIEQQYAEHLDERAALLAHHWEEAGEALSAARWHRRAAEWVGVTDFAAATRHWGRVRALLRELPDDREAAALGIAACRQLLNVGFRVGTGLDEARALLEEGQALANAIGDRRAQLYLSLVYGRARCGAGDVATCLELAIENQRAALEIDDLSVQANASLYLCFSLLVSGRLPEAIQVAEQALARLPRDVPPAEWLVGANPFSVLPGLRGRCLAWAGRLAEGLDELGRGRRLAEEDGTPEIAAYALCFAAEASHLANDADRALASARQVEEVTRRLGEMPTMVAFAQLAFGHANLAAGRAADAIEPARAALDLYGRVEKYEAGMAASLLAEALLEAGDLSAAEAAASEAIALCRRSLRGIYEAVAHGVLARALLRRDGAAAHAAAEAALAEAAALIERTGAKTLAPSLCEWRAELAAVLGDDVTRAQLLRQAQRGYDEIGAPAHAQRVSRRVSAISAQPKGQ